MTVVESENDLCNIEKTRSADADEGCTVRIDLHTHDHVGKSFSCLLHQLRAFTSGVVSSAFDKYVGSSVFKLSNSDGSERIKGNIARLSKSFQVGCMSKISMG